MRPTRGYQVSVVSGHPCPDTVNEYSGVSGQGSPETTSGALKQGKRVKQASQSLKDVSFGTFAALEINRIVFDKIVFHGI